MIDSSGNLDNTYSYDSWGVPTNTTETVPNPHRYAAGFHDNDRSTKFGTRYYDPTLNRWTQHDAYAGTIASPRTLNRYAYAGDDPVNNTDPSGRIFGYSWDDFTEDVAGAAEDVVECVSGLPCTAGSVTEYVAVNGALLGLAGLGIYAGVVSCATLIGCIAGAPLGFGGAAAALYGLYLYNQAVWGW